MQSSAGRHLAATSTSTFLTSFLWLSCREEDNLHEAIEEAAAHKKGKVTDTKLTPEQLEEVSCSRHALSVFHLNSRLHNSFHSTS
jgi:hypothetical protein